MSTKLWMSVLGLCLLGMPLITGAGHVDHAGTAPLATPSPRKMLPIAMRAMSTGTPSSTPSTAKLNQVKKWVYQLTNYQNNKLEEITRNAFDMAVTDLARDGNTGYFTTTEISKIKASGKIVLAYFTIGSIEDYRPELDQVEQQMPDIILGRVDGWPEERYVKYWDERWWIIVKGRIDQAISAGYDGAYLDLIFAYEDINPTEVGLTRTQLARKMVELIARIANYARSKQPSFLIMPQNNPELYTDYDKPSNWNLYLKSVDGLAVENMYYLDSGDPCTESWCAENIANASEVGRQGKPVFSIDYSTNAANIQVVYKKADAAGFIPYVSKAGLPACYLARVWPLTKCE